MKPKSGKNLEMIANEAFVKRAAKIDLPFMLKGSYVTRQYFPKNIKRFPADLDWVYLEELTDEATAREKFTEWATLVTELDLEDEVKFISFKENAFWRMIDYAMADDFPTVNTDLICWVEGIKLDFSLDISFNLEVSEPPIPLLYKPIQGESFIIPNTVPISLQVAWKIHQTLVRPRFKDLFDLTYLVRHPEFDVESLHVAMQALINECYVDNIDLKQLNYFLKYDFNSLFPLDLIGDNWSLWRHDIQIPHLKRISTWDERAKFLTNLEDIPTKLEDFLDELSVSLNAAGLNVELVSWLPKPKLIKSRAYKDLSNKYLYSNSDLNPINIKKLKFELGTLKNPSVNKETIFPIREMGKDEYKDRPDQSDSIKEESKGFFSMIKNIFRK